MHTQIYRYIHDIHLHYRHTDASHIHIHTCINTCTEVYTLYKHTPIHSQTCQNTHIHTHTHTHTKTQIYRHTLRDTDTYTQRHTSGLLT